MAKKETVKKEFAWDTEKKVGEFGDDKRKTEVRICTLNGKTYVSAQHYVWSNKLEDFKRSKNNTMELSLFKELQDIVGKWELEAAFEGSDIIKEKKPAAPKSGGLKAKKQAQGASKSRAAKTTAKK